MFGKKYYLAWIRSLSGLSINISAIWFTASVIGPNLSLPRNPREFVVLTFQIVFGIVFLLITVLLDKGKEKYE